MQRSESVKAARGKAIRLSLPLVVACLLLLLVTAHVAWATGSSNLMYLGSGSGLRYVGSNGGVLYIGGERAVSPSAATVIPASTKAWLATLVPLALLMSCMAVLFTVRPGSTETAILVIATIFIIIMWEITLATV